MSFNVILLIYSSFVSLIEKSFFMAIFPGDFSRAFIVDEASSLVFVYSVNYSDNSKKQILLSIC